MRRILAHLDDVGATSGSVVAWRDLRRAGAVRSASVMVPCPWYRAAVADWHDDPAQDLGIHLTLTSEWQHYRWRPMLGCTGGLCDAEGFFHRRPEMVLAHADPQAVEAEMEAQVARALADGIRPTHLDAHMGTALLFWPQLLAVADRHAIPAMISRDPAPLFAAMRSKAPRGTQEMVQEAERRGWPVFDAFLMGFVPEGQDAARMVTDLLAKAPPGLSWYACHANAPGDFAAVAADHAAPREAEYDLFTRANAPTVFGDAARLTWHDLMQR